MNKGTIVILSIGAILLYIGALVATLVAAANCTTTTTTAANCTAGAAGGLGIATLLLLVALVLTLIAWILPARLTDLWPRRPRGPRVAPVRCATVRACRPHAGCERALPVSCMHLIGLPPRDGGPIRVSLLRHAGCGTPDAARWTRRGGVQGLFCWEGGQGSRCLYVYCRRSSPACGWPAPGAGCYTSRRASQNAASPDQIARWRVSRARPQRSQAGAQRPAPA